MLLLLSFAASSLTLPDQITSNMVLQQSTQVRMWGVASPNSEVRIARSWNSTPSRATAASSGAFEALVDTPAASFAPQTLTISCGAESIHLANVLVGEVFLGAGQSNMAMPLDGFANCPVRHSDGVLAKSTKCTSIRMATVAHNSSLTPLESAPGRWQMCGPSTSPSWSAVGFFFARALQKTLQVPVGALSVSWAGARLEAFLPRDIVEALGERVNYSDKRPAAIAYNNLIWPVRRYTVRGVLWYQGESNVGFAANYSEMMSILAAHWRSIFAAPQLPFLSVQIAPFLRDPGLEWALLREAQFAAQFAVENLWIIATGDLVDPLFEPRQLHPQNKRDVARRLAWTALNHLYGYSGIACDSPSFDKLELGAGNISVYFKNAELGLSPWADIRGFEIAGSDTVFHDAEAKIGKGEDKRTTVVVWSPKVPDPVAVRYCFRNWQVGNLHNVWGFGPSRLGRMTGRERDEKRASQSICRLTGVSRCVFLLQSRSVPLRLAADSMV
jgi:sialate O-acetylesterase